jgi:DNA-binding NarL/FixJ family response regulator
MPTEPKNFAPGALRVLVVDDLRFMCIALRQIIEADGDLRVVGEARNGEEACALARELKPDVITMDIEMPVMDGIEATRRILAEIRPVPVVIMVSSYTQAGAAATINALRLGAADFVSKESTLAKTDLGHIDAELRAKIRLCAGRRAGSVATPEAPLSLVDRSPDEGPFSGGVPEGSTDLVAIAASTGGPDRCAHRGRSAHAGILHFLSRAVAIPRYRPESARRRSSRADPGGRNHHPARRQGCAGRAAYRRRLRVAAHRGRRGCAPFRQYSF